MDGIVIKATSFHSNQGIYVLVDDPNSSDPNAPPLDLMTGMTISIMDVITQLTYLQASKIIVEEFIGTELPTEFKFHVFDGKVAAIDIIAERGKDCPCYASVEYEDGEWNRLDDFGCFEPTGLGPLVNPNDQCTMIDFDTGKRKCGPVKKDLYLCDEIPVLESCVIERMIGMAEQLGSIIGVYVRVDMFVVYEGDAPRIYVQEYTTNHMNGLRHCSAKLEDGCIDSCFLGKLFKEAGLPYGGVSTDIPAYLNSPSFYEELSPEQQCAKIDDANSIPLFDQNTVVCP
jgi:hypothetical protein